MTKIPGSESAVCVNRCERKRQNIIQTELAALRQYREDHAQHLS